MPTYEFACPNGHDFEKFYRTMSAAATELPCPVCGAVAQRQVSAGAGLVFKGSGFYITDYGKDGKKDLKSAAPAGGTKPEPGAKGDAAQAAGASTGATAGDGAAPAPPSTPAPAPPPGGGAPKSGAAE